MASDVLIEHIKCPSLSLEVLACCSDLNTSVSKLHFPSCLQHPEVAQRAFVLQFLEFLPWKIWSVLIMGV